MTANLDVFVGNDTLIDPDIYQLWLNGHSAQEAASLQQKRGNLQHYGATFDMLLTDILDHYRTFGMLERYLKNPGKMADQQELQIASHTQALLIEKYYEFDSVIVREILGKKLTSRFRNALDDIGEKTHIPLRSCRRQFDNIKRVYKAVEDMTGSLVDNIQTHFLLSQSLAQQYTAIVFIENIRFDLSRKKLAYLTFVDFVYCSNLMITNWSSHNSSDQEGSDVELDREFLQGLRELKFLSEKEYVEHKSAVLHLLEGQLSSASVAADIDTNFKSLTKGLINVASGLNHSKELRDFFTDLLETVIEPCRSAGWTQSDVQAFFRAYIEAGTQPSMLLTRCSQSVLSAWLRYMNTVGSCVVQMYHS